MVLETCNSFNINHQERKRYREINAGFSFPLKTDEDYLFLVLNIFSERRLETNHQPSPFTLVMMAANESTHVAENENDSQTSPENSGINVVELSSIVEPTTPADVIVQRQIREVILLQDAAVAHLHESVSSPK